MSEDFHDCGLDYIDMSDPMFDYMRHFMTEQYLMDGHNTNNIQETIENGQIPDVTYHKTDNPAANEPGQVGNSMIQAGEQGGSPAASASSSGQQQQKGGSGGLFTGLVKSLTGQDPNSSGGAIGGLAKKVLGL